MTVFTDKHIQTAIQKFGSPLYLYDADHIRAMYQRIRLHAPTQLDVFFSMKANPLLGVGQLLNSVGGCCEVCSAAELHVALHAGFLPENIIFVGPGKTIDELALCVEHGIYAVVCESFAEMDRLALIAADKKQRISVLLRINPNFTVDKAPLKMGGKPTQFGVDINELRKNKKRIRQYTQLKIIGIHVYNGTRILDADGIIKNTQAILALSKSLSAEWSIPFSCVDIGGGFGVAYFANENELDVEKVFRELQPIFAEYLSHFPDTRFILESGRFLVGQSGVLIGEVLDIKQSHQEQFIICDAGMHCHMAATGIGSFVRRNFPMYSVPRSKRHGVPMETYHITGPLCTPGDVLARSIEIAQVQVGDYIVVERSGAYGPTASPTGFLSHGYPAEVMFDHDTFYLMRPRQTKQDILAQQVSLATVFNQQGEKNGKCCTTGH